MKFMKLGTVGLVLALFFVIGFCAWIYDQNSYHSAIETRLGNAILSPDSAHVLFTRRTLHLQAPRGILKLPDGGIPEYQTGTFEVLSVPVRGGVPRALYSITRTDSGFEYHRWLLLAADTTGIAVRDEGLNGERSYLTIDPHGAGRPLGEAGRPGWDELGRYPGPRLGGGRTPFAIVDAGEVLFWDPHEYAFRTLFSLRPEEAFSEDPWILEQDRRPALEEGSLHHIESANAKIADGGLRIAFIAYAPRPARAPRRYTAHLTKELRGVSRLASDITVLDLARVPVELGPGLRHVEFDCPADSLRANVIPVLEAAGYRHVRSLDGPLFLRLESPAGDSAPAFLAVEVPLPE